MGGTNGRSLFGAKTQGIWRRRRKTIKWLEAVTIYRNSSLAWHPLFVSNRKTHTSSFLLISSSYKRLMLLKPILLCSSRSIVSNDTIFIGFSLCLTSRPRAVSPPLVHEFPYTVSRYARRVSAVRRFCRAQGV